MYTVTTDQEKLELFLATRTQEAFCLVCDAISPRLMRYFRGRGCDVTTAEDLTQDVLFSVYRRAYTIREPRLFESWLFRVARNSLLQLVRASQRRIRTVAISMPEGETRAHASVSIDLPGSGLAGFLSLSGLDEQDREILLLRYFDGLDYREISAMLDIPVGTAKWRVFNSKMKLAAQLGRGARKK